MLKHGEDIMVEQLVYLFNNIWWKLEMPSNWKKGIIVKLPKKGDLSECNNCMEITLLSMPWKVFTSVLLNRLSDAVDQTLQEGQAGLRKGWSCTEQIFALRNILEQSLKYNKDVVVNKGVPDIQ